jgi:hypothetical protein
MTITIFTRAHNFSIPKLIESILNTRILFKVHFNIILLSTPRSTSGFLTSVFSRISSVFLICVTRTACPVLSLIWLPEQHALRSTSWTVRALVYIDRATLVTNVYGRNETGNWPTFINPYGAILQGHACLCWRLRCSSIVIFYLTL